MAIAAPPKPKLTPEQTQAIQAGTVSVALSAGAGCGKTFVLTERFLAQLEAQSADGRSVELRELVAITYTERAAREMRERIRRKCLERVQQSEDPTQARRWWKLLRELDSARVSTIHSFCGALLRSHAVEAELDPGFQVLEEGNAATLLAEITDDALRGWLVEQKSEVLDLIVRFNLDGLRGHLRELSNGPPAALARWRDATVEDVLTAWEKFHRETYVPLLRTRLLQADATQTILAILRDLSVSSVKMAERRGVILSLLPNLPVTKTLAADLEALMENAKVAGGKEIKGAFPDDETYDQYKAACETFRKEAKKLGESPSFDADAAKPSAAAGLQLLRLALEVREEYTARKRQLAHLDFDDLIAQAHRLLTAPENKKLRKRVSDGISLLLVDEFQDTDPIQVELVKGLCGDALTSGKLFFVGDRKQSIYRFRGAAPQVFRQLQDEMPNAGRLPLTKNFRSQPAVIDFVNGLFRERFQPDYEALVAHREQVSPLPAAEFWWTVPQFGQRTVPGGLGIARQHEADHMARRLRELIDSGTPTIAADDKADPKALRPLKYGDICILFRALSDVRYYEQALQDNDIPYYLVGGKAFYAQQEIFDVLNLLRALDSTADDVALAGVLRSPFFALTDETLFWLTQQNGGLSGGLYGPNIAAGVAQEQRPRVAFAARTLCELREQKDRLPIAELLQEAISRTSYDAIVLAEFLGERKLANLRKLIDEARGMDRSGLFTLSDFVTQLSEAVADQPKEALAATHPEAANVVRLMSIHQSKGLEFPFVVVADINRQEQGNRDTAVFHAELGPLVRVRDADGDDPACCGLDLYKQLERAEDEAESDRLFYVATTRAADHLVLSSCVFDMAKPTSRWMKLLAERFDLTTGEFLAADEDTETLLPHVETRINPVVDAKPPFAPRRSKVDWEQMVGQARHLAERKQGIPAAQTAAIPPERGARRQYSFSRLTGSMREKRGDFPTVADTRAARTREPDEGPPLDPLGLGTLVHAALAEVDYAKPDKVHDLVQRHAALHVQDDPATVAAAVEMIARFVESAAAKRISAARERHVELEFLLAWPPNQPDFGGPLLHGFIDCLYQDAAGAWHLVDYKTNRVTVETVMTTSAQYELQMGVYALAAEAALGAPPASLTLYFLAAGLEHTFVWDGAARKKVIAEVERLMREATSS